MSVSLKTRMQGRQGAVLALIALSAIVWLIFGRTLTSYFLADDFGEVAYCARILAGRYDLIWANFTGNFMQIPSMAVWRPWLLISLLVDHAVWGVNAFGFYLTNVLSFNVCVIELFVLVRMLAARANPAPANVAAFFAALLFAVSPLHSESVSWVVGRVDIVCCAFYLASLLCLMAGEKMMAHGARATMMMVSSVVCWWLAMWTKEMAIGLPIVAYAAVFLFGERPARLRHAFKVTWPLFASLILYFILRYLALGTILGGYVNGIGDAQAANAVIRWLDIDTVRRLLLPLPTSIFKEGKAWQASVLMPIWIALATVFAVKLSRLRLRWEWLVFAIIWGLTTLAPVYKLWGLGYDLEGARFCFFLTMPLAVSTVLLLLPGRGKRCDGAGILAACFLIALATINTSIAIKNNLMWVQAGRGNKALVSASADLSRELAGKNMAGLVTGIPHRNGAAHMILNGPTYEMTLQPPFQSQDLSQSLLTFEPLLFAENDAMQPLRYREIAAVGMPRYHWDADKRAFELQHADIVGSKRVKLDNVELLPRVQPHSLGHIQVTQDKNGPSPEIAIKDVQYQDGLSVDMTGLASADLLIVRARQVKAKGAMTARSGETVLGAADLQACGNGEYFALLPVSRSAGWFVDGRPDSVFVQLPGGAEMTLQSIRPAAYGDVAPVLASKQIKVGRDGCVRLNADARALTLDLIMPICLSDYFDKQSIKDLKIEITKSNQFFEQADQSANAGLKTKDVQAGQNRAIMIDESLLPAAGYFQMRAVLTLQNGLVIRGNELTFYKP